MNTHQAYLEWIDQKIHEHQTEIARLTVARQVLGEMPGLQQPRLSKPRIKTSRHPTRGESRAVQQHVINWIGANPGAKPIDMLNGLGVAVDKAARRPFYNAMTRLMKEGALIRDDDGRYSLAAESTFKDHVSGGGKETVSAH